MRSAHGRNRLLYSHRMPVTVKVARWLTGAGGSVLGLVMQQAEWAQLATGARPLFARRPHRLLLRNSPNSTIFGDRRR